MFLKTIDRWFIFLTKFEILVLHQYSRQVYNFDFAIIWPICGTQKLYVTYFSNLFPLSDFICTTNLFPRIYETQQYWTTIESREEYSFLFWHPGSLDWHILITQSLELGLKGITYRRHLRNILLKYTVLTKKGEHYFFTFCKVNWPR